MSTSAPPGQPSIRETLNSSFRDGASVARTNLVPAAVFVALGTIVAVTIALSGGIKPGGMSAWLPVGITLADLSFMALSYFAIAAAVRTMHPSYRMTFGQFICMFGYSLLVGLLTALAAICLIVPGYWVGVKLMLTPYTYVVTNGAADALKTTWNMTTGYYWQTVGLFLLLGIYVGVLACAAYLVAFFIGAAIPVSTIVLAPLALAVLAWLVHVQALVYVRWTNALLPRANIPGGIPVPA
jgi:hypothetical protein